MRWNQLLLSPFSLAYRAVTDFRNHLFDIGYKKSFQFDVPVIGVGNLTVGGTGKTPMVEYLVRLLANREKVVTLSRGYGRKTKGFRVVGEGDSPETVGDEPFQMFEKFSGKVTVTVGEERSVAIPIILHEFEETSTIILDDAFQHRYVSPSLNIMLTDYGRPFWEDYVLPAGRLRESRKGAGRADIVVVTKCPGELSEAEMATMERNVKEYAGSETPVCFTTIGYVEPVSMSGSDGELTGPVALVSGLGNAEPFERYAKGRFEVAANFRFGDHHKYSEKDGEKIASAGLDVLTTEKDSVKLSDLSALSGVSLYYLPIETRFLKGESIFVKLVEETLEKYKK
ncbi:tetraacyldisaccharide 4'-kinase [Fulvitalea axinellae]|uniref:Tetraacyldisaccharide 4'-kinase n=1 Tax=Fulvitalea axinellae TaxID=1182444 RepID=A0AAU9CXL8_9BACT|nr:tetraacyldisaccharide 4'-kinase [Fulvitalea axinellae]